MTDKPEDMKKFNLIRVAGSPNYVEFSDGLRIYNDHKDYILMPEWGRKVRKAPYDNHFLARVTQKRKGWFAYCSCGSPAVVTGYKAYAYGASPSAGGEEFVAGEMLVCHHHTTFGRHQDGSQ